MWRKPSSCEGKQEVRAISVHYTVSLGGAPTGYTHMSKHHMEFREKYTMLVWLQVCVNISQFIPETPVKWCEASQDTMDKRNNGVTTSTYVCSLHTCLAGSSNACIDTPSLSLKCITQVVSHANHIPNYIATYIANVLFQGFPNSRHFELWNMRKFQ